VTHAFTGSACPDGKTRNLAWLASHALTRGRQVTLFMPVLNFRPHCERNNFYIVPAGAPQAMLAAVPLIPPALRPQSTQTLRHGNTIVTISRRGVVAVTPLPENFRLCACPLWGKCSEDPLEHPPACTFVTYVI